MLMMLQLQKSQGLDDGMCETRTGILESANKLVEDTDSSKGLVTDHTHSSTSGSLANFVNDEPAGSEYAPEESDHSDLNMSEDEKGMGCDDSEGDPQEGNGIDGEGNDAGMAEGRGEHEDEA